MILKRPQFLFLFLFLPLIFFLFISSQNTDYLSKETDSLTSDSILISNNWRERVEEWKEKEDYAQALEFLENAQNDYSNQQQWEDAVACLVEAAKLGDYLDEPDAKLQYSNQAVFLAQRYLSQQHSLLASALRQKAEAFMWIEKVDSANHLLTLSIPIFAENCMWTDFAWSEILLGINYFNQYELQAAQVHLNAVKTLLSQKKLEGNDALEIQGTLLFILGRLYQTQGDYDRAIQNTKEAIQLEHAKYVIDSTSIRAYFNNLGVFYFEKGDYQRSLDYFIQALHSHQEAATDPSLLYNIGHLFYKQEQYDKSINYYHKSLQIAEGQVDKFKIQIDGFQGLGRTFKSMGIYDSVVYYCQKAIAIPNDYRKTESWSLLGNISCQKQHPEQAILYFGKALKAYQKDSTAGSHSPFFLSYIYRSLGDAHFLNQDFNKSLKFYQKSLIANHTTFKDSLSYEQNPPLKGACNSRFFLDALYGKAKTLATFTHSKEQMETALATYQLLGQWIDTLLVGHTTEAASLDWTGQFKQIYEEAIDLAHHLYQESQDLQYLDIAFAFSEKSKNNLLLESLKAAEGKTYAGVPDSLRQKEKDLNIDVAFYERVLQEAEQNQDTAKIKLYQQYFSDTRLQLATFQERLERDFPKYHSLKYGGQTISIATVQAELLEENTAFVEYFMGDSAAYAFVITAHTADLIPLERSASLQEKTTAVRELLLNPYTFRQDAQKTIIAYQNAASELYQAILQPVVETFLTPIERLIVVTDEFLHAIPLEALTQPTEKVEGINFAQLPFVLREYSLQYAYSADLLLKNRARQTELSVNTECLAFAPPYQGADATGRRGSLAQLRSSGKLEGTAREIQAIAQYFDGHFDFGKTATERQFKATASEYGILHLAMHGVPDLENPNFNHLKFSDLETDSLEDNLLHHYEIANLNLQAQLAVLSACETGVGKYEKGEGVYSLARSFMYAGVPSVVMSLWKVSDYSTSELMPFFYENLSEGQPKEVALRDAKIRFLEEAKLEHRHPFYWSAFVLLGDNRAIQRGWGNWWLWGIGGLVLMGGIFYWRMRN